MAAPEKFTDIESARDRAKSLVQTSIDIGFPGGEVYVFKDDETTEVFSVSRSGRVQRVTRGGWLTDESGKEIVKKKSDAPCVVVL